MVTVIERLIGWAVANRAVVLLLTAAFAGLGVWSFQRMTFDAFPDLTNVQVQVLTTAPGLSTEDVELFVTVPVERALAGTPDLVELRSRSRTGVSAITAVFRDGTDLVRARALVQARLEAVVEDIPPGAGRPELAPPTTGLGEVFQFTMRSDEHTLEEVTRIFERDVAPRLRMVPGVVEVNVWGAASPQLDVLVDPFALAARGLALDDVSDAVERHVGLAAGGALERRDEAVLVRALANPATPEALAATTVARRGDHTVRLDEVARVTPGRVLTVGLGTADAEGEALFVMVQLLAGADALRVVRQVRERLDEVVATLPAGLDVAVAYDREQLVGSTLRTVARSLIEGGLLVILILLLMLGDLRAGLIVASVIPLAMLGAFTGLYALGYSGNLMSLGAVDFGLVVDGTIVVVESVVGVKLAADGHLGRAVVERARAVARPVLFSSGVLWLVYVPVLLMTGTEGKLFRPMALTVLLALTTAIVLSFTYVPALGSLVLRPSGEHVTPIVRFAQRLYHPLLSGVLHRWWSMTVLSVLLVTAGALVASRMGVEFTPRLEEGDIVVQTGRLPSISRERALEEALRVEAVLQTFPEVERVATRTGAPGVATDPMGMEEADVLVRLRPRSAWRPGVDIDELVTQMERALREHAPGASLTFTQPIEMRFNELLQGIRSDVGVVIYGRDLDELARLGREAAAILEAIPGAADVVPPVAEGMPSLDVELIPERLAQYGLQPADVMVWVRAVQRGLDGGRVVRGEFRDPLSIRLSLPADARLEDLPLLVAGGESSWGGAWSSGGGGFGGGGLALGGVVPLGDVARLTQRNGAVTVSREAGSRRMIVQANVRGRDTGSFVDEARARIAEELTLPEGYWVAWSGTIEELRAATRRTAVLVPGLLLLIVLLLWQALGRLSGALLILLNVPVAISGGVLLLAWAGMPISMSAIVGFIALAGIAVMNAIVMLTRTRELESSHSGPEAAELSARERFRPVLTTAMVAGFGFVPMALAQGTGAEVQRPLATVIIGGLVTSTALTLLVIPALYARFVHHDGPLEPGPGEPGPGEPGPAWQDRT